MLPRETAWVTGAGGLIGHYAVQTGPAFVPQFQVIGLKRNNLDLLDFSAVRRRFAQERPAIVIHCAALSRSPDCQANPALARRINVEATALLSELAADATLVFFSTDLVFDGKAGGYTETSAPNPLSTYAETKLQAEAQVRLNPRHIILRTSLNGGLSPTGDRGFNEQMRRDWLAGRKLRLFTDEFRSPCGAEVTARAAWELALKSRGGIYHVAGSERLSRWEIGLSLAKRWPQFNPSIEPASLREYQGDPRSPDTSLNCSKAQELLSFRLPAFREWLAEQPEGSF